MLVSDGEDVLLKTILEELVFLFCVLFGCSKAPAVTESFSALRFACLCPRSNRARTRTCWYAKPIGKQESPAGSMILVMHFPAWPMLSKTSRKPQMWMQGLFNPTR